MLNWAFIHFSLMAHYHLGANVCVYAVHGPLSHVERERKGLFRNINGFLEGIPDDGHIWIARFEGEKALLVDLGRRVLSDFTNLRAMWVAEIARIRRFVDNLKDGYFEGLIDYV